MIYLHGNGKQLANMDIDCDGQQGGAGEDGRCGSSGDTQSQTSFKDTIIDYKVGISDLNAKVHTYVVFGNDGTSPSFDPQKYGIEPLSVMAVVCGNKLVRTRFLLHLTFKRAIAADDSKGVRRVGRQQRKRRTTAGRRGLDSTRDGLLRHFCQRQLRA